MTFQLQARKPKTEPRTHEPTGVTVHFKRIGHLERTRIAGEAFGNPGLVIRLLAEPGVGVHRWEGVKAEDGKDAPYTLSNVDAAAEAEPSFGEWFNDTLLEFHGWIRNSHGQVEESADEAGKSEPPSTSSEADAAPTPALSSS